MKTVKVYELDCREKCNKVGMKMSSLLSNHRSEVKAMQFSIICIVYIIDFICDNTLISE